MRILTERQLMVTRQSLNLKMLRLQNLKMSEVNVKNLADKEEMLKVLDENGNFVGKFEKKTRIK